MQSVLFLSSFCHNAWKGYPWPLQGTQLNTQWVLISSLVPALSLKTQKNIRRISEKKIILKFLGFSVLEITSEMSVHYSPGFCQWGFTNRRSFIKSGRAWDESVTPGKLIVKAVTDMVILSFCLCYVHHVKDMQINRNTITTSHTNVNMVIVHL